MINFDDRLLRHLEIGAELHFQTAPSDGTLGLKYPQLQGERLASADSRPTAFPGNQSRSACVVRLDIDVANVASLSIVGQLKLGTSLYESKNRERGRGRNLIPKGNSCSGPPPPKRQDPPRQCSSVAPDILQGKASTRGSRERG